MTANTTGRLQKSGSQRSSFCAAVCETRGPVTLMAVIYRDS
jgi:hypothetical protein